MRPFARFTAIVAIFGLGYFCGMASNSLTGTAVGQDDPAPAADGGGKALSDETKKALETAATSLNAAVEALKLDQAYIPATKGINTFGVFTGGIDALKDLEEGLVDPETFAALYAGLASDEIADKIGRDAEGRITYNGRIVRMYSVSRLRALFAARAAITGEEISAELGGKKPAAKKAEEAPAE